jgi:hypothetical protein
MRVRSEVRPPVPQAMRQRPAAKAPLTAIPSKCFSAMCTHTERRNSFPISNFLHSSLHTPGCTPLRTPGETPANRFALFFQQFPDSFSLNIFVSRNLRTAARVWVPSLRTFPLRPHASPCDSPHRLWYGIQERAERSTRGLTRPSPGVNSHRLFPRNVGESPTSNRYWSWAHAYNL